MNDGVKFSETKWSAIMTQTSMPADSRSVATVKPQVTAAHKALLDRKVMPLGSLYHGAYYSGFLDDATATCRWNATKRRFVFWDQAMQQPGSKTIPHVADLGLGPRFAPLSRQEPDRESRISDFTLVTAS